MIFYAFFLGFIARMSREGKVVYAYSNCDLKIIQIVNIGIKAQKRPREL